jgi:hypothetical protein
MPNAGMMTLETVVFACCNAGIVGATAVIAKKVDMMEICTVCFAIQWIVFLLHAGPLKSEVSHHYKIAATKCNVG